MRFITRTILLVGILFLYKLNAWVNTAEEVTPAQTRVIRTLTSGAGGGILINSVCGTIAPFLDPKIAVGSEAFASCAPYGVVGSFISARLYAYTTGGWGPEEWAYAREIIQDGKDLALTKIGLLTGSGKEEKADATEEPAARPVDEL